MPLPAIDAHADEKFRHLAHEVGLDPDDPWVGEYAEYEWNHARHYFEVYLPNLRDLRVLEFGCNLGASSIVLAALGARVTAIDIEEDFIRLARANSERYGLSDRVSFISSTDTTQLAFPDSSFDCVVCNSVLEYVAPDVLSLVLKEIDRVLVGGGSLLILGTSNRLWPREVHSRRWWINYVPVWVDRVFSRGKGPERGIFPWNITRNLRDYSNPDKNGRLLIETKRRSGVSGIRMNVGKLLVKIICASGLRPEYCMPSISVSLRKPA